MRIQDCCFLVTGGASGLGRACAQRLVASGARVVIGDTQQPAATRLAEQLGDAARAVELNVTLSDSIESALALAASQFGPLRGVIHCAGILGAERLLGREGPHDLERFAHVLHVNLVGTFNVTRLAAARMVGNEPDPGGERGVIINTSSVAAFEGQVGQAAYAASKGGVASMTLPLARELARHGIRVVAIAPGMFDTAMIQSLPEAIRQSLAEQTIFPARFGSPDEFAALALHVMENPMLNGTTIRLDGAVRLQPKP